jgi:nucleotidyltransferase/DNA polymerase involved in DNA repair
MPGQRFIVHVDMDAFFAAVEQRDNPSLRGRPVVIGADPKGGHGRGVVAACSYEARSFGLHSAMPISQAYQKCPQAVFLRGEHTKYGRESEKIFVILERFTPDLEPVSIDEAFLDITASYHLFGTPEETCRKIKAAIKAETGLTASIGLAPNKMTAKIASDIGKPNGLVVVTAEGLLAFLHPLPVGRLWGVGEKTRRSFERIGIKTIGDLARRDRAALLRDFGQAGDHVWRLANGLDPRNVAPVDEVKSVGNEHTFEADIDDRGLMLDILMALSEHVSLRMRRAGLQGRTVTLKIRLAPFSTYTRASTLPAATNFAEDIFRSASEKLKAFPPKKKVRLLGVSVSNLNRPADEPGLFPGPLPHSEKKEKLHQALDKIKEKFGEEAIRRRKTGED